MALPMVTLLSVSTFEAYQLDRLVLVVGSIAAADCDIYHNRLH